MPQHEMFYSGDAFVCTLIFDYSALLQSKRLSPDALVSFLAALDKHVRRCLGKFKANLLHGSGDTFQVVWSGTSMSESTLPLLLAELIEITRFTANYAELNASINDADLTAHIGLDYGHVAFDGTGFVIGDAFQGSYRLAAEAKRNRSVMCFSQSFVDRFHLMETATKSSFAHCSSTDPEHRDFYYSGDLESATRLVQESMRPK